MWKVLLLATVLATSAVAGAQEGDLRSRADAAKGGDCARVCIEFARNLVEQSNNSFTSGNVDIAQKQMTEAVQYAQKGAEAAMQSHRRQKHVEIALREMANRVDDIKKSLNFEDQAPLDHHIAKLNDLREKVLDEMFGNPRKSFEEPEKKK